MGVVRVLMAWALLAGGDAFPTQPGRVFLQIQCGTPPAIAATHHAIELRGDFWPNVGSHLSLMPLAGRIDALRIDGHERMVASPELRDGFLELEGLGRIFLAVAAEPPGYRAVLLAEQIEQLEPSSAR